MSAPRRALLCAALAVAALRGEAKPVGAWPLCEASAAVRDPLSASLVWVADNERAGELFAFDLAGSELHAMRRTPLPGGDDLRDIEALAARGHELLVVASHSRDRRCEFRPKRWQLRWLDARGDRLRVVRAFDSSALQARIANGVRDCLAALFVAPVPVGARELCEALHRSERDSSASHCDGLDIEGAVALPASAEARAAIWLGLRSPLVGGRAPLVRLTEDARSTRFDAVASIDLGGRGIRELALADGMLWGIAGPRLDSRGLFSLWGVPRSAIAPGARVPAPARQRALPPASEALVIERGVAVVLTDGSQGARGSEACEERSAQLSVELP